MKLRGAVTVLPAVVLGFFLTAGVAGASTWCGHNGVVKLSFTAGDSLSGVANAEPDETGLTAVDLYAVLDQVDLVSHEGEKFLGLGGFELQLIVEGAEAIFQEQNFDFVGPNLGRAQGQCHVGINPGLDLVDGRATLVHWRLLFRGRPQNVVFRLDPGGLFSTRSLPAVAECNPYALYVGTLDRKQVGLMFGAGYVPAYLNWEGKVDLVPVVGKQTWQDVGACTLAEN